MTEMAPGDLGMTEMAPGKLGREVQRKKAGTLAAQALQP